MKILQVIPYFYPAWRFGGPVRVAYDISKKLVELGHSVTVYTSDIIDQNSRVGSHIKEVNGINVFYLKNMSIYAAKFKIYITPSLVSVLKKDVKSFDIVHIHGNRTSLNPVLYYFLKKNSVPYIVQAHGGIPRVGRIKIKWIYDRVFGFRFLRDASRVVALNRLEANQYKSMGVSEEKIVIVPNGINLSEYSYLPSKGSFRKKYGIKKDEKIVLYLGRINKSKGLDLLADAFSVVSKSVRNVRLVLVGPDDGYMAMLSKIISDLDLDEKVLMTGFVETQDKLAALVDGDVFVTPRFSGFPITFLEACLACCPIVTTSNELDWIHNNVGYVVQNSTAILAEAISTILEDRAIREMFESNCKSMILKFNVFSSTTQLEKVYEEVLRDRL